MDTVKNIYAKAIDLVGAHPKAAVNVTLAVIVLNLVAKVIF